MQLHVEFQAAVPARINLRMLKIYFPGVYAMSSAPSGRTLGAKRFTNPWISMDWIGLDRLNSLIQ